jgi:DNA-binding MarR family transcriptional regulator
MCDTNHIEFVSTWELVVMLRRCQHHLEVTMDQALQGMGMSFAQYRALEALASNNAMHISWLARMLRLSRQTARSTVLQLAKQDLVETVDEGYEVTVHVLPKGRKRLRLCRDSTRSVITNIEERLSMGERVTLHGLLTHAERAFQPPPPRVRPWWLD